MTKLQIEFHRMSILNIHVHGHNYYKLTGKKTHTSKEYWVTGIKLPFTPCNDKIATLDGSTFLHQQAKLNV